MYWRDVEVEGKVGHVPAFLLFGGITLDSRATTEPG